MEDLQISGASFVFTSDTEKEALLKFTTSVGRESAVMLQSLPCAENIIVAIPVFMDLDANPSRRSTESPKTICWNSPLEELRDED